MEGETVKASRETGSLSKWPWTRSLAMAGEGTLLQVEDILFGRTRDHCERLGIKKGSMLVCMKNGLDGVEVSLPGGARSKLDRDLAWFVLVRLT